MDKYAALDLGTNTFHLLIASFDNEGRLIEHYRKRHYIYLAKDGIEKISDQAYERAITCIKEFSNVLKDHNLVGITCSGTAALRTATNGTTLVREIKEISGIEVDVIDGITEARYIYDGVSLALPRMKQGNFLIMDIGGGSVEFIVIKDGHFFWSNSYPIGIAVLKREYHLTEPIARDEVILINQFIRDNIAKLTYVCRGMHFESLVGASGSFEVLAGISECDDNALSKKIALDNFEDLYEELIPLDLQERLKRSDIPDNRAHLIVVAFQLIHYLLTQIKCDNIIVSKYAMKEGMLSQLAQKL